MSSVVSEAIILIAVVVAASFLSASFMSGVVDIQRSTLSSTADIGDAIKTSVKIIHVVKTGNKEAKLWIKNVGSTTIYDNEIELADLYFGEAGSFVYMAYVPSGVGWNYTLLGDTSDKWNPQDTMEITVTTSGVLGTGDYFVSFSTHNGIKDDEYFSIG